MIEARPIFQNISPLDHRYSVSERAVYEKLTPYLSEEASIKACIKAEVALTIAHLKRRSLYTDALRAALEDAAASITPDEVYEEEEKTRHNIRALVNVLKKKAPPEASPFIHLGATSVDILDSAQAYRIKGVTLEVVLPLLASLEKKLVSTTLLTADIPQTGRTHGQSAVPITLGFSFAEFVSRLGGSIAEIRERADCLKGKLSGACGAYNALSLITDAPEDLERAYLAELGLEPAEYSTQIVPPEYLLRLLLEFNTAFGIIANLADNLRHLQRSEIGEVHEAFGASQVGSSTMPQKRNPWNSEHVKSLWKAFSPRVITFFMDQISEHQRDLTNSASMRFIADYIAGFCLAIHRLDGVLSTLTFDRERLASNLRSAGSALAESAYILLAESGESAAHEVVRRITLTADKEGVPFIEALKKDVPAWLTIKNALIKVKLAKNEADAENFFLNPENYTGLAAKKARTIAEKYS